MLTQNKQECTIMDEVGLLRNKFAKLSAFEATLAGVSIGSFYIKEQI